MLQKQINALLISSILIFVFNLSGCTQFKDMTSINSFSENSTYWVYADHFQNDTYFPPIIKFNENRSATVGIINQGYWVPLSAKLTYYQLKSEQEQSQLRYYAYAHLKQTTKDNLITFSQSNKSYKYFSGNLLDKYIFLSNSEELADKTFILDEDYADEIIPEKGAIEAYDKLLFNRKFKENGMNIVDAESGKTFFYKLTKEEILEVNRLAIMNSLSASKLFRQYPRYKQRTASNKKMPLNTEQLNRLYKACDYTGKPENITYTDFYKKVTDTVNDYTVLKSQTTQEYIDDQFGKSILSEEEYLDINLKKMAQKDKLKQCMWVMEELELHIWE